MSRFGIRKRLRRLVGGGDDGAEEIVRYEVTYVLPEGVERTIQAEEHYSLLMAADASGITISTGRRAGGTCPDGRCGLCRVEIEDPSGLSEMKPAELQSLDDQIAGTPHEGRAREPGAPKTPDTRLGCHARILGSGARVRVLELFDPDSILGE